MKKKYYLFLIPSLVIFSVIQISLAEELAEVNEPILNLSHFNDSEKGELNGQNEWSDVWNSLLVQDRVVFEGDKAIKNQDDFAAASYKELDDSFIEKGVISLKIKIRNNSFSDNQDIFGLYRGIGEDYIALLRFANDFDGRENMLLISLAGSTDVQELGTLTQGEWHKISLGWRNEDFKVRIKIDDNEWTDWFESQTEWDTEQFGVKITLPEADKYGDFYIDDIKSFIGYGEPVVQETEESTATTTIKSDLDEGEIVTAQIDGDLILETSTETATSTSPILDFILDLVEDIKEAVTGTSEESTPPEVPAVPEVETPVEAPIEELPAPIPEVETPVVPVEEVPPPPQPISSEINNNETTTTTF